MLTEESYISQLLNNEINPDSYICEEVRLSKSGGIKREVWNNCQYDFNFYDGIYVLNSPEHILDFLILWQYLKSEMLILETPQQCTAKMLGLFHVQVENVHHGRTGVEDYLHDIDFDTLTYSDDHYFGETCYQLSHVYCTMYQEFLGKRIYPSANLKLFIEKGFCSSEERAQKQALLAAWLAIAVSIVLSIVPSLMPNNASDACFHAIENLTQEVTNVRKFIEAQDHTAGDFNNFDVLRNKLDTIIESLSNINDASPTESFSNNAN